MIRIEHLEIHGYRHLRGAYAFEPGLTVVTGPNESGKSTLHDALAASMFGFSSSQRRRHQGSSEKERRRPWSGAAFGVTLRIVDRHDRRLRVRWDFGADSVEVRDADTGSSVLSEAPGISHDYTLGPELLGLSREDYEQLGTLMQDGLHPVEPTETLRSGLQRAVEATAGGEGGLVEADARLRELLSRLGVHGGHYGTLNGGALSRAEATLDDLDARLVTAANARTELADLSAQLAGCETALADLDSRALARDQAALRAAAQRSRADHRKASDLQPVAGGVAGEHRALPAELEGRVSAAHAQLEEAAADLERRREAAAAVAEELADARRAARDAEADRDRLSAYADVDTAGESSVRDAVATLRAHSQGSSLAAPESPADRDPLLARFRAASPAPVAAAVPGPSSSLIWAGAALCAGAGVVGAVAVDPALAVLLVVGVVLAAVALRRRAAAPSTGEGATFEGRLRADLIAEAEAEDRAWLNHEVALTQHERAMTEARAARDHARQALRQALAERAPTGTLDDESLPRAAGDYLDACDRSREATSAAGRADAALARVRELASVERGVREGEAAVTTTCDELWRLLRRVPITGDDLGRALDEFGERLAADRTSREQAETRADAAGRLQQLLAGRTIEELDALAAAAEAAADAHATVHGTLAPPNVDPAGTAERDGVFERVADLRARIDERESTMEPPAELDRARDEAATELERTERHRDAARLAREELAAAASQAHSVVAPHLNRALLRVLPRITRGRYRDATVDEELSILVVAPGTGDLVEVEDLSRGTRDQIALIERLELARLLDPTGGGAPLLLDDCFAHTDEHRLPLAIELLVETARQRQVILFTDDRDVVAAVRAADGAAGVVELPDPVGPTAAP